MNGINVRRAIGDVGLTENPEEPVVIHKSKITMNKLQPGDTLILGCDGLKDYVPENEIVDILAKNKSDDIANQL